MMKFFRFIYSFKMTIAWIFALFAVIVIGSLFKGQSFMFTGIAEATETVVSVQNSVNVIKIHVTPGEEVVVVGSMPASAQGVTNFLKLHRVGESADYR